MTNFKKINTFLEVPSQHFFKKTDSHQGLEIDGRWMVVLCWMPPLGLVTSLLMDGSISVANSTIYQSTNGNSIFTVVEQQMGFKLVEHQIIWLKNKS